MALRKYKPTTSSLRHCVIVDKRELWKGSPEKSLTRGMGRSGGRNNAGRLTAPRRGSHAHKRVYRTIDTKRKEFYGLVGIVERLEYDPNRTAHIALVRYAEADNKPAYIIAPKNLKAGDEVISGDVIPFKIGNATKLKNIPVGFTVHNVELKIGKGGQMARAAGAYVTILGKENNQIIVRLKSGETRLIHEECMATIGEVSNADHSNQHFSKAGRQRWKGIRPRHRAVAGNPIDHPMGGGEGKSSGGRHPCSRNGQAAKGLRTRNNKRTDSVIIKRRTK